MDDQPSQSTQQSDGPTFYTIAGIRVEFPTKAYPSQLAMMGKVIQGLKQGKNCLLESPTGSGKSLALLCAALAWQRHEAVRVGEYNAAINARELAKEEELREFMKLQRKANGQNTNSPAEKGKGASVSTSIATDQNIENHSEPQTIEKPFAVDDDEDFKPPRKSSISPPLKVGKSSGGFTVNRGNGSTKDTPRINTLDIIEVEPEIELATKRLTVPKVFFGTRTHKQIAQITRELRKTTYRNVRSTILSSREHACINPIVMLHPNKNEACKELLENYLTSGCGFHGMAKKFGTFENLPYYGVHPGFDLEDLIKAGREAKACPYYASRHLMSSADIIFCPYNYLIDPMIRKSINIEIEGQIIIFDEGHNLEYAAREAASFNLSQEDILEAIQDTECVGNSGVEPFAHEQLAQFLSKIGGWINDNASNLNSLDYNNSGKTWNGTDLVASMMQAGIDSDGFARLQTFYKAIMTHREQQLDLAKERGSRTTFQKQTISSATIYSCDLLIRMFDYLIRNAGRERDDFRMALLKSIKRRKLGKRGGVSSDEVLSMNFWCLNPAVEFAEIKEKAHCIILTSGTLSPMSSFQSELGTSLPIKLEASHVIDPSQIWAGVVGRGPNQVNLNGSYRNAETFDYQDEVGRVVANICSIIPHGVLCFFSSYRALETLTNRWSTTGQMSSIERFKKLYVEPRTGVADFEEVMRHYYYSIANYENNMTGLTGALFLAVFRGKVSEGMDFADNNARAVICIGIPFPNYRELQVTQKREYNDRNKQKGLLSGSEWYEVQAFRALNQALGRCIRHRYDWGAIVLIDDRYSQTPRYLQSLPRWIRSSVKNCKDWTDTLRSITQFRDLMKSRPFPASTTFGVIGNEDTSSSGLNPHYSRLPNNRGSFEFGSFASGSSALKPDDSLFKNSTFSSFTTDDVKSVLPFHPIQFDSEDEVSPQKIKPENSKELEIPDSKDNIRTYIGSTLKLADKDTKPPQRRQKMITMFY